MTSESVEERQLQKERAPFNACQFMRLPVRQAQPPIQSLPERRESPVRRAILELVRTRPGLPMREVARQVGIAWGTTAYHVERLQQANLLLTVCVARHRLLYPVPMPQEASPELDALLLDPTRRMVATAIAANPRRSVQDLVEEFDVSSRVVYHHVKALREAGLVEAAPGHHRDLCPTPLLARLARPWTGTPTDAR